MKPKLTQVLLIFALAAAFLLSWSVYAQEKKPGRVVWEYSVATVSSYEESSSRLSQFGSQGWELVSVRSSEEVLGNTRIVSFHYYLKRPKS
jgi:hypothetical protein